jgi:hypothetical protein
VFIHMLNLFNFADWLNHSCFLVYLKLVRHFNMNSCNFSLIILVYILILLNLFVKFLLLLLLRISRNWLPTLHLHHLHLLMTHRSSSSKTLKISVLLLSINLLRAIRNLSSLHVVGSLWWLLLSHLIWLLLWRVASLVHRIISLRLSSWRILSRIILRIHILLTWNRRSSLSILLRILL